MKKQVLFQVGTKLVSAEMLGCPFSALSFFLSVNKNDSIKQSVHAEQFEVSCKHAFHVFSVVTFGYHEASDW